MYKIPCLTRNYLCLRKIRKQKAKSSKSLARAFSQTLRIASLFQVQLPDGRVQLVTYSVADQAAGYVADVSYSGEAIHAPAVAQEQVPLRLFSPKK